MGVSPCEFESRPGHKTAENFLGGFSFVPDETRSVGGGVAELSAMYKRRRIATQLSAFVPIA